MTLDPKHVTPPSGLPGSEEALRILSDASAALSASLDDEEILARVGGLLVPGLADWCLVDVVEGNGLRPADARHADPEKLALLRSLQRGIRYDLDPAPPQVLVLRERVPVLVSEAAPDFMGSAARDEDQLSILRAVEPRSVMLLPLTGRGGCLGVLTLVRSQSGSRYEPPDLAFAAELARRVASALENARLHRDLAEAMRLKSERDGYLQTVFRQLPGLIWTTDRDLRFTYVTGHLPHAPGVDCATWVGSAVHDVLGSRAPTDPAVAHHRAALSGEAQSFECRFLDRWYEVKLEPLRDPEGHQIVGIVGAAFDVTERRATEERLARNEARLAEAQRIAHVGSFEWDIKSNVVTVTEELGRILGVEPRRLEGSLETLLASVHPADLGRTRSVLLDALRESKSFVCDHRVVRTDRSVRALRTRGDVVKDAQGHVLRMVGTSWDITELTEATQERERSLSLLQAAVESTADGILVVDRMGKVTLVNRQLQKLWDISAEKLEMADEVTLRDLMLEKVEDRHGFWAGILEVQDRPESESTDVVRLEDGRVYERRSRPQRVGQTVVGRVWSYRDVSERERLLGRALLLSDATRLIASLDLEKALDAVARRLVPDLADACVIDLLEKGTPRRTVVISRDPGKPVVPPAHPAVLAGQGRLYHDDESSLIGVPLCSNGAVLGAMTLAASAHRAHEQKDLELAEELGRRIGLAIDNARLYQSAQEALRARDEFLAIASHELRNPLAPIHASLHVLEHSPADSDQGRRARAIIERQVKQLTRLVSDLLDVGRVMRGKVQLRREPLDVREIVSQAVEDHHRLFEARSLVLAADLPDAPAWVDGDSVRLSQIVGNLLQNAAKFTPAGGQVFVRVRQEAESVALTIRDTGVGIPPVVMARLFEPFVQADRSLDRSAGGLGLGLSLVKGLAELHGGEVLAKSEGAGLGAEFVVRLPAGTSRQAQPPPRHANRRRRRILIIEDDADSAESLRDGLALSEHDVVLASTGAEGLAKARVFKPDVVLCDIGLPGMDGYEVAHAFRQDVTLRASVLVALTGYASLDDQARARSAGFDQHLAKPVDIGVIERVLDEAPSLHAPGTTASS